MVLSACGKSNDSTSDTDMIKPINAALKVPEKAVVNEAVKISVTMTQDAEAVDNAEEVQFEVWKDGAKSTSEMIASDLGKDGVYTAEKTSKKRNLLRPITCNRSIYAYHA